jgi:hypothetical protein
VILPAYRVQSGDQLAAKLMDHIPNTNIMPFGMCAPTTLRSRSSTATAAPWRAARAMIDAPGKNGTIVLNGTMNISLTVGSSSIIIAPAIIGPQMLINSRRPSPASPIDPNVRLAAGRRHGAPNSHHQAGSTAELPNA